MDIADPAAAYATLKAETAKMLNLDVASSSLLENLQVDLVSLLRLQIDDLQGKVLSGEQVDLNRLSTALGMLRTLLPEKALVSQPPPAETRFSEPHKAKLREMIERIVLAPRPEDHERDAERAWRDEYQAIVAAGGNVEAASKPAGSDAWSDGAVAHPALSPAAPAAGPPQRRETDIERMNRVNATPANPPRGPREVWRVPEAIEKTSATIRCLPTTT